MPKKKETSYEELMSIHRQESGSNFLSKISSDFYRRVVDYLDALRDRCGSEDRSDSDISGMLLNQLKRAQDRASEIYELRMRKIALMAMNSAFGGEPRLENMTKDELEAFKELKDFFASHHDRTLIAKRVESAQEKNEQQAEETQVKAEIRKAEEATIPETADPERDDTVIVRILENLPAFAGTERNYQLRKEDVISLPRNIAEILLRHNKAIEIKHSAQ